MAVWGTGAFTVPGGIGRGAAIGGATGADKGLGVAPGGAAKGAPFRGTGAAEGPAMLFIYKIHS